MDNIYTVIDLQVIIFLFLVIGFVLRKVNVINNEGKKCLTDMLIMIILPCNIIHAFMIEFNRNILERSIAVLIIALLVQIVSWILGKMLYTRVDKNKRGVMKYGTMCSNAGFMGNPIAEGLFGAEGLMYASIYLIPLRFFMWTAGIACFSNVKWKMAVKKLAVHPCIIAVWIGFFLMLSGISLPTPVEKAIGYISNCNLSISIIVIGAILAEVKKNNLFDKDCFFFSFVRLILLPCVAIIFCKLMGVSELVTGVCVILTCMPAGSTTAILAEKYGGDARYAAKIVLLSTVLSLFTIPIFCLIITKII